MARASVAPRHRARANRRMDRRTHLRHLLNRGCWRQSDGAHKLHLHRRRHRCALCSRPRRGWPISGTSKPKSPRRRLAGHTWRSTAWCWPCSSSTRSFVAASVAPRVISSAQFAQLAIVGVILLAISGYLGGYMVYDHGTGISRMSRKKLRHIAERGNAHSPRREGGRREPRHEPARGQTAQTSAAPDPRAPADRAFSGQLSARHRVIRLGRK